jgi:hypothetical protein
MPAGCRTCGLIRWLSFPSGSRRLTLECAEGGLPVIEAVIEVLYAVQLGVRLEGLADFEHPVHAGGVPGDAELVEGLPGVGAGGLGVVLGGFDGGQVAEDDRPLLIIGAGRVVQRGGEGFLGLREVPGLELGVAFEGSEPYGPMTARFTRRVSRRAARGTRYVGSRSRLRWSGSCGSTSSRTGSARMAACSGPNETASTSRPRCGRSCRRPGRLHSRSARLRSYSQLRPGQFGRPQ